MLDRLTRLENATERLLCRLGAADPPAPLRRPRGNVGLNQAAGATSDPGDYEDRNSPVPPAADDDARWDRFNWAIGRLFPDGIDAEPPVRYSVPRHHISGLREGAIPRRRRPLSVDNGDLPPFFHLGSPSS